MTYQDKFIQRLKDLKNEQRLTQEELADKLYISRGKVAMWESGRTVPNFDDLINLANLFDVSVDWLLGIDNDRNKEEFLKRTLSGYSSRW